MKIQFVKCPLYHTCGLVWRLICYGAVSLLPASSQTQPIRPQGTTLCNDLMAITEANKQALEVANAKHQICAAAYAQFNVKTREAVGKYICEN